MNPKSKPKATTTGTRALLSATTLAGVLAGWAVLANTAPTASSAEAAPPSAAVLAVSGQASSQLNALPPIPTLVPLANTNRPNIVSAPSIYTQPSIASAPSWPRPITSSRSSR